jgi:hypothetical protein
MRLRLQATAVLAALTGLPLRVSAQPNPPGLQPPAITTTPVPNAADAEWRALKNQGKHNSSSPAIKGNTSTAAADVARLLDQANQLQAFRSKYPGHPAARESKQMEAVALAIAAVRGDTTSDQRRTDLVEEVRADQRLPVAKRFEAVAWSKQISLARQKPASRAALMEAHEAIGRQLIAEFPTHFVGYESLLGVAQGSAPVVGARIAGDVARMADAPVLIKAEAALLVERFGLIGRPLVPLLASAGASSLAEKAGSKLVVVYTWASTMKASHTVAGRLAKSAPGAALIGINLDTDLVRARQAATDAILPGYQYYDPQGAAGPLARALKLNRPSLVLLVDSSGVIRDVQGNDGFAEKIRNLSR